MAHQYFHRDCQQGVKGEVWAGSETRCSWRGFLKLSRVVAVATLLLAEGLYAQTSMVIGTITYHNGRPAANVFVSIGGRYRYTDVGGRYKLNGVPQGRQHMIIKSGQKVLWQGDVNITGSTATVDHVLA